MHDISNAPISEILGVDLNNNMIRDDVEDYIIQNYSKFEEQEALKQYTKELQLKMLSYDNPEESNRLRGDYKASKCAYYVFGIEK